MSDKQVAKRLRAMKLPPGYNACLLLDAAALIEALQAEVERLREVRGAAQAYFNSYMQDEAADDAEEWVGCTPDQHLKAKRLRLALAAQQGGDDGR